MANQVHGEFFDGTKDQAQCLYQGLSEHLTEVEQYVLLRYLGLNVPKELTEKYWTMTDGNHAEKLRSVKAKLRAARLGNGPAQKG